METAVRRRAQVVKWQTRWLQVPVLARAWRFDSSPGHPQYEIRRTTHKAGLNDRPFARLFSIAMAMWPFRLLFDRN